MWHDAGRISWRARRTSLTGNLLNETRVGFNRVSASVFPETGGAVNRSVGLPEPWTNTRDAGLSLITVTGYAALGHEYNNPQSGTTNTIHVADTLTWTRGHHLLRAGFDGRLIRQNAFRDVQARGSLTFTGAFTGSPMVDLLTGLPTFTTLAAPRQPAAPSHRSRYACVRAGQLSHPAEPHALGRSAVRRDIAASRRRRSRHAVQPRRPALCSSGHERPPAQRLQHRPQQLGAAARRSVDRRRRGDDGACALRTAFTTTNRLWRRARACTSMLRISFSPPTSRRLQVC